MQNNEDGVENALENNYSFSLFHMKNSFCLKDIVAQIDGEHLN